MSTGIGDVTAGMPRRRINTGRGMRLVGLCLAVLLLGCELRPGQIASSTVPTPRSSIPVDGASQATARGSVGPHLALTESTSMDPEDTLGLGEVWVWGRHGGQGRMDGRPPRVLPERLVGLSDIVAVAAGRNHLLTLAADGTVWMRSEAHGRGGCAVTGCPGFTRRIDELKDIVAVAAGESYSLALASNGTVWAWGANQEGQLGNGTRTDRATPAPVPGLTGVTAIAAGDLHNLALLEDGTVRAWGNGAFGRLGIGTIASSTIPAPVVGLRDVTAIAAGSMHSLAIVRDGTVWTWGYGLPDRAVDGTLSLATPVRVDGVDGIVAVAAGQMHSLALGPDGRVWAWGYDDVGELGDGTADFGRSRPEPIGELHEIVALAAGDTHSLALEADGTVWAWGSNIYGEAGGTRQNAVFQATPAKLPALTGVKTIAAKGVLSVAIQGPTARHLPQPRFQ